MNQLMGIVLAATSVIPAVDMGVEDAFNFSGICDLLEPHVGIGLTVAATDTEDVDSAVLTASWGGVNHPVDVELTPGTESVSDPVALSSQLSSLNIPVGSSTVVQTRELLGFAVIEDLPAEEVSVTVDLLDDDGEVVFTDSTVVTPELTYPNGPNCEPGVMRADIRVEDGVLS